MKTSLDSVKVSWFLWFLLFVFELNRDNIRWQRLCLLWVLVFLGVDLATVLDPSTFVCTISYETTFVFFGALAVGWLLDLVSTFEAVYNFQVFSRKKRWVRTSVWGFLHISIYGRKTSPPCFTGCWLLTSMLLGVFLQKVVLRQAVLDCLFWL